MKIVLNKCYGGFSLSPMACNKLGLEHPYAMIKRTDDRLIMLMQEYGSKDISGHSAKLVIVDLPDNCTDWEIDEYDGIENITYVVDGKLHHA